MQNKQEIADAIFNSIDVIVDKKLEALAFNKTIVAQIAAPFDVEKGYLVKSQNISFFARPIGAEVYTQGDIVYILVPNNSSNQARFIIGCPSTSSSTQTLLTETVSRLVEENRILKQAILLMANGNVEEAKIKLNEIKEE